MKKDVYQEIIDQIVSEPRTLGCAATRFEIISPALDGWRSPSCPYHQSRD
jgi:hypothetical protein